jgi:hypothetical protein
MGVGAAMASAADLLADLQQAEEDAQTSLTALSAAALSGRAARASSLAEALASREPLRPLAGRVRLLAVAAVRPSAPRHTALGALMDERLDDETETIAAYFAMLDDATAARHLLADDRYNRGAHLVNDALRPFSIGSNLLAVANPILLAGSALDSILTTTSNLLSYDDLSLGEREALALYRQAARRDPTRLRDEAAAADIQALRRRWAEGTCEDFADEVERLLREDDLERARYRVHSPLATECDEDLDELRRDTDRRVAAEASAEESMRWPVADVARPSTSADWEEYRAVAVAVLQRDAVGISRAATRLLDADDDGPFAPGAQLTLALGRRLGGDAADADDMLETLADEDGSAAQAAGGLLADSRARRHGAIEAAERQHRRDVMRYVLLGPRVIGRTAVHGAARLAAYGAAGAQTLGITNAVGVITRGWRAWRRDPASNARIIDEGEVYLDRHADGDQVEDVRASLIEAYAREERYGRALMHAKALREPDSKQIADLEERLAKSELSRARRDGDLALVHAISRRFPDTKAAEQAREVLVSDAARGELPISREVLEAHAALLGPSGLDLPPGLLDGDRDNGELTEHGVSVTPTGLSLSLVGEDGAVTETITLDEADLARVQATAREILYERERDESTDEEAGRWERYVPVFVTGAVGEQGVSVTPGLKPRATGPEHPDRYQ